MDHTPDQALERVEPEQPDILHGVVSDDPGTPCTPEYARELTERALRLADELDGTLQEIVRVKAWEPLGYTDPGAYVLSEFTQSSRAHRYRLARLAAFMYQLTERIGDEALELRLTERALRNVPSGRDGKVLASIENRLADTDGSPAEVEQAVADSLRAHSRNAPSAENDMWEEPQDPGASAPNRPGSSHGDDEVSWDEEDGYLADSGGEDRAATAVNPPDRVDVPPPSKADLAEAGRYEEFVRAMRVIAATGGELPGILDNADEAEEEELRALAEQVEQVAVATGEALTE